MRDVSAKSGGSLNLGIVGIFRNGEGDPSVGGRRPREPRRPGPLQLFNGLLRVALEWLLK